MQSAVEFWCLKKLTYKDIIDIIRFVKRRKITANTYDFITVPRIMLRIIGSAMLCPRKLFINKYSKVIAF